MTTPVILILLLSLLSALVCYVIGLLVIKTLAIRTRDFLEIFFAEVIGLSLIVTTYALWVTKGQTILALLPIFVLIAAWYCRRTPDAYIEDYNTITRGTQTQWRRLMIFMCGVTSFFIVRFAISSDPVKGQIMTASQDYVFYSKITYALNIEGIETQVINPLADTHISPQPYHYLDLWSDALLARLTSVPSMLLLHIVVYSIMLAIVFIGLAAIYERFISHRFLVIVLALLSVFTCGSYWPLFSKVPFLKVIALSNVYMAPIYPKIVPIIIFLLLGYCFFLQVRYVAAAWIWAALAIVYTIIAPAVCVGGCSIVVYLLIRQHITRRNAIQSLIPYVIVSVNIGVFYFLSKINHPDSQSYAPSYWQYLPKIGQLRTVVNSIVGTLLAQAFYYGPYFLLIIILLAINRQPLLQFLLRNEALLVSILLFALASAGAGAVMARAIDGFQLGANLLFPLLIIGIAILVAMSLQHSELRPQYFATGFLSCVLLYNLKVVANEPYTFSTFSTHHNALFVKDVASISPKMSRFGALILDKSEYTSVYRLNNDISTVGMFIALVRDNTPLLSISVADFDRPLVEKAFDRDTAAASHMVRNAPFTQFVRHQHITNQFSSIEVSQRDFLIKNGINFICASPSAHLPATLQAMVIRTLFDPVSKQKLYLLNVKLLPKSQPVDEQFVRYTW